MTVTQAAFVDPAHRAARGPAAEHDLLLPGHATDRAGNTTTVAAPSVHGAGPDAARHGGRPTSPPARRAQPTSRRPRDGEVILQPTVGAGIHRTGAAGRLDRSALELRGLLSGIVDGVLLVDGARVADLRDRRQRRVRAGNARRARRRPTCSPARARSSSPRNFSGDSFQHAGLRPDLRLGVRTLGDLQHVERRHAVRAHQHR